MPVSEAQRESLADLIERERKHRTPHCAYCGKLFAELPTHHRARIYRVEAEQVNIRVCKPCLRAGDWDSNPRILHCPEEAALQRGICEPKRGCGGSA